jgi:hypothetical protein
MIGIVRIQQCENGARIPEDATPDAHVSRIACLSRAPGVRPPLRPAPIRRKMGCFPVKGGISPVTALRAAFRVIVRRTRRRPPRLTLGMAPLWSLRQSVERETPNVRIASLTVSRFSTTTLLSQECHCFICLTSACAEDFDSPASGRMLPARLCELLASQERSKRLVPIRRTGLYQGVRRSLHDRSTALVRTSCSRVGIGSVTCQVPARCWRGSRDKLRVNCPLDSSPVPRTPVRFSRLQRVCPRTRRSTLRQPPVRVPGT